MHLYSINLEFVNAKAFDSRRKGSIPFRSTKMVSLVYVVKRLTVNEKNRVRNAKHS